MNEYNQSNYYSECENEYNPMSNLNNSFLSDCNQTNSLEINEIKYIDSEQDLNHSQNINSNKYF